MRDHYFRVEHSQRPTITELQEKILQHALRDLGIDNGVAIVENKPVKVPGQSAMRDNIHRWAKMHMAEKNL